MDSAVVTLRVQRPPRVPAELEPLFRRVVRGAFSTRRKTLANALAQSGEVPLDKAQAQAVLEEVGVAPERRAETLSVEEFLFLTRQLAARTDMA